MRPVCGLTGRIILAVIVGLPAGGCTTWKTQAAAPEQIMAREPDQVRVTLGSGIRNVMARPSIVGDSLIGSLPGPDPRRIAQRMAVPLADVRSIEVQRVNAGRTALLIAGVGITALAVIAAATYDEPFVGGGGSDHPAVSCPLVYSWDGTSWRLDSGTFGGAVAPALARTDVDNLVYATAQNGVLRLRVANELNETDYLDALSLLAVDHAPGLSIAPDGEGGIHAFGTLVPPVLARDDGGQDALARVRAPDGWGWESTLSGRDTARLADIRDGIELKFLKPADVHPLLIVDGNNTPWAAHLTQELIAAHGRETRAWYDSLAAFPALARGLGEMMEREAFLGVSVWSEGKWQRQGYIWEAGPEIVKRQVFALDLARVRGDTVHVRLESAPSFWIIDHVALTTSEGGSFVTRELKADRANDRGGQDIRSRIESPDGGHYVMENGASAELSFRVPDVPVGQERSYLVRSSGWYRIHAAEAKVPDVALLRQVLTEPYGASRVAVSRMNQAMQLLGAGQ
jgi:hypothetical protein